MRVWAIRYEAFTELRSAGKAPSVHITEAVRTIHGRGRIRGYRVVRHVASDGYVYYTDEPVFVKELKLKQAVTVGGNLLAVVKNRKFTRLSGLRLKLYTPTELAHNVAIKVLKEVGYNGRSKALKAPKETID